MRCIQIFAALGLVFFAGGAAAGEKKPLTVRGVVSPAQQASISVNLNNARLIEVPFEIGDRFPKNAVLLKFDCAQLRAEYDATRAAARSLELRQKSNLQLLEHGAAGELDVAVGKADLDKASAEARARGAMLKDCEVRAPYRGYVVERRVDPFETPNAGALLLKIIDDSALEIEMIVPAAIARRLSKGDAFRFRLEGAATAQACTVLRVGRAVDPVSQTVAVVGVFAGDTVGVMAGLTGVAEFGPSSGS